MNFLVLVPTNVCFRSAIHSLFLLLRTCSTDTFAMSGCLRLFKKSNESSEKNATKLLSSKTGADKSEYPSLGDGVDVDSFSSSTALNPIPDSSQVSEIYQRSLPPAAAVHEATLQDTDNVSPSLKHATICTLPGFED